MLTHKQLRTKALANAEVKAEYEKFLEEFSLLDEFLKARAAHDDLSTPAGTKCQKLSLNPSHTR
jgi:hypothetical protein